MTSRCRTVSAGAAMALALMAIGTPSSHAGESEFIYGNLRVYGAEFLQAKGKVVATVASLAGSQAAGKKSALGNAHTLAGVHVREIRFEELDVPVATGARGSTQRAWRVTVKGGPFPIRDEIPVLWSDDTPLGAGGVSANLDELSFITTERNLLTGGKRLFLSWGVAESSKVEILPKLPGGMDRSIVQ